MFRRSTLFKRIQNNNDWIKTHDQYLIALNSKRKFEIFSVNLKKDITAGFSAFLNLLAQRDKVKNVDIKVDGRSSDQFKILLSCLQNVAEIKITFWNVDETFHQSLMPLTTTKYQQLKILTVEDKNCPLEMDILSETMEVPMLEKFICKRTFPDSRAVYFAVKWSNHNLKYINIEPVFMWTSRTLRIGHLPCESSRRNISKFIEDHAIEDFPKIRELLLGDPGLSERVKNLIFENCINVECLTIITELKFPFSTNLVFKNLKALKLVIPKLWCSEAEFVKLLMKLFPNIEVLEIKLTNNWPLDRPDGEIGLSTPNLEQLIKIYLPDLKLFYFDRVRSWLDETERHLDYLGNTYGIFD